MAPDMQFTPEELDFLSAWAREEKALDPYTLPGHQLQAAHQVRGITLIRAIKAWARTEGRRDEDVFHLKDNPPRPGPGPRKRKWPNDWQDSQNKSMCDKTTKGKSFRVFAAPIPTDGGEP